MLCILYIRFRNVPKCPTRPPKAYGLSAAQSSTWEMKRWVAGETGAHFLDANACGCEFNTIDFMHLTKKGHAALAAALAKLVPELLSQEQ